MDSKNLFEYILHSNPIARSEEELFKMLSEKRTIDISVYDELAPKYNLDFLKGILK
tara:strand:- start:1204 stop:1371 length:168 start_codon:yes stop_codon:yes gene_type:complete